MKTLKESLFDKDLASQSSIEKLFDKLSDDNIKHMDEDVLLNIVNTIINSGNKYSKQEMKKHPIDLSKQIMIAFRTNLAHKGIHQYVYYFNMPNSERTIKQIGHMGYSIDDKIVGRTAIMGYEDEFYWDPITICNKNVDEHWKEFITHIYNFYHGCEFIVLDEQTSKKLFKSIMNK